MKKPNVSRSGERLLGIAHALRPLSERLLAAGFESESLDVRSIATALDEVGRRLISKIRG